MSSGEPAPDTRASALAEAAYALVQVRPREALALAERARAAATAEADSGAEVAAIHALSWAQMVLGDPRALRTARAGIRLGERHGERRAVALLRRRLALSLAFTGATRAARREIDAAIASLSGRDRAQSELFRVAIHRRAHAADPAAHREVVAAAARALRVLRRHGDEIWEARLLYNRGLLFVDRGELDAAEADLRSAYGLYSRLGAEAAAVDAAAAIAWATLRQGDVLGCLELLEEVEAGLAPGHVSYNLEDCRAMALAQARLLPEARAAAEAYVEHCTRTGIRDEIAKAVLDLAAIAMMASDPVAARRLATQAARSFSARGKPVNAALARATCLRAQLADPGIGRSAVRSGLAAAAVLETAGWRRDALRTRLLVARAAIATGAPRTARRQLELALPLLRRGSATDRIELCHTRALLRLSEGDRAGAERFLVDGLRLLEDYRAVFGAAELRATASGIGVELSELGLRIAGESREPARILAWAERLRGNALRTSPVRPPADRRLGALQAELRGVTAQIREAEEHGTVAPRAAARQSELESTIRRRSRLLRGHAASPAAVPDARAAADALGESVLVEYVALDRGLGAITLAGGRLALHELGTLDAELEWLRFALARGARATGAAERAAARSAADSAAAEVDRLLLGPLRTVLADRPLVLVPTGALHALPWAALPSLRGRALVVTPSLAVWLELARRPRSRRRKTALVAGPRLRHSNQEVRDLAPFLHEPTVLAGRAATANAALDALDGAALAHLACHGRFRSDSPLFSSLELADGPLNVYELQRLRHAPEVVVLSACDLALSALHPGDELLGVASALLAMGTRTIVASVVPVPDAMSKRVMLAFHRALASGLAPAAALAGAQARAAVPGFVCIGSG